MLDIVATRLAWQTLLLELSELEEGSRKHASESNLEEKAKVFSERVNELLKQSAAFLWPSTLSTSKLEINTRQLAAFLVCKVQEGRQLGDISANTVLGGAVEKAGIAERLIFCKRVAVVVLLGLQARPCDFDSLRCLLWLVCEYGHEVLGLDRRIDLEKHLGLLAMEQPALYGLKRFYRDHLNHVVQDCLLGWLVLETQVSPGGEFFWQLPRLRASKKEVLRQWFVAALLHDVGYVVEVGKGWTGLLEMFDSASFKQVREGTLKQMGSLHEFALARKEWCFRPEDKPEFDHGVASAIHAQEMLDALGKHRVVGDFSSAINAIARHNHWRVRIDFAVEPLSALLVLCDEVQEWDRPWIQFEHAALAVAAGILYRDNQAPGWHEDLSQVCLNVKTKWNGRQITSRLATKNRVEFEIRYNDQIHYQDKVFATWIGRSEKLQRLDLSAAVFDVRYKVVTGLVPPANLPATDWEPRMERLRRLVRTKQQWCIYEWLPRAELPGKPQSVEEYGVGYQLVSGEEFVELSAKSLGRKQPIAGSLENFWKAVATWDDAHQVREPVVW